MSKDTPPLPHDGCVPGPPMVRIILAVVASAYLGAGLFAGLMMQRAIPALNTLGVAYIAATWPKQIACARVAEGCDAVPDSIAPYLFTFEEPAP